MNRPTVLRNSAEPEIVIGIALKIFYIANDWIDNATFLDRLDHEYDAIGKTRESRSGGQAIAKYKPAVYYGLIDTREDGLHCINDYGRRYYEAYKNGDNDGMVDCLVSSIATHEFGRNNLAVPESKSRIEPPKVFLVSCLLLNNILSKTEYAYILESLSKDKDYQKILVEVSLARLKGSDLVISDYAKNNYRDDKGLKFLSDAGFFDEGKGTKSIKQQYVIKYSEVLSSLAIVTSENITHPHTTNTIHTTFDVMSSSNSKIITAIHTKPFLLLAGISGTGKSRIVRELAFKSCPKYLQDKDGTTPGNYCMIEVKPNWHDSTELLGYYSNLSKGYQFKKFVQFLVKAKMNPEIPFFVCLDEMNLAPVEQYFAEILSILETRKHPKNSDGEVDMSVIKSGVIVEGKHFSQIYQKEMGGAISTIEKRISDGDWYASFFKESQMSEEEKAIVQKNRSAFTLCDEGLTLPDNVIIIGTVNMDDTTHQFSRKVIDRAMTIEMNGGKLKNMFGSSNNLSYLEDEEQKKWQAAFKQVYVSAYEVLTAHPNEADQIVEMLPEKLEAINEALKGTPFEVSYRVLNELTIMVGVMLDDTPGEELEKIVDNALDRILLMKILPRIEGDSDMFNLKITQTVGSVTCRNRLEWLRELAPNITSSEEEGKDHQQTAKEKIEEMIERLENQEFTRFWP